MSETQGFGPAVEFTTIVEMFDNLVEKFGNDPRPAVMSKSNGEYRGISYTELKWMVERFSCGLAALGARRGDRIALISENRPEWIIADMAMMRLGAVNVSLFTTLAPKQIEFILNDSGAKYAIVSNLLHLRKVLQVIDGVPALRNMILISENVIPPDPRVMLYSRVMEIGAERLPGDRGAANGEKKAIGPDDLLTLVYTSGTTGTPKGVMLTHRNLVSNIVGSAACIPLTDRDRVLSYLPLSHSYERMAGYYTAMACGATIAYAESTETLRENLLEVAPTVVMMVPRILERLHDRLRRQAAGQPVVQRNVFEWAIRVGKMFAVRGKKPEVPVLLRLKHAIADRLVFGKIRALLGGRIRFLVSGGAALSPGIGEFFQAAGITIIEGYGMTESSPVISFTRLEECEFGTVGRPIPGVEVRIAPDGEILVRGPNVMKGYWNDPSSTAEVIDREGWLHTGDIGMFNERGFLVITDRKKHLFVTSGGKNIAPQAVESLFHRSEYIDQFVLIGDGRMFLTALIVPVFERIREYARGRNLVVADDRELVERPEIRMLFETEIALIQKDLASFERVRKFAILNHPFTAESGELTPTLKVRRIVVEARYKDEIERMYAAFR
jgi:long-chain acyl-CoA synthetase